MKIIAAISFIAAAVISCAPAGKPIAPQNEESKLLFGTNWKLTEVQGLDVPAVWRAMIAFKQGEPNSYEGNTGCNKIQGNVNLLENAGIKFLPAATTRMACYETSQATLENKMLAVLSKANAWKIEDNTLLLLQENQVLARFKKQRQLTPADLQINGSWELQAFPAEAENISSLFGSRKPIMSINVSSLQANGYSGCNNFSSTIVLDSNKISFTAPVSTKIACAGKGEAAFFNSLKTIDNYQWKQADTLQLLSREAVTMVFVRR